MEEERLRTLIQRAFSEETQALSNEHKILRYCEFELARENFFNQTHVKARINEKDHSGAPDALDELIQQAEQARLSFKLQRNKVSVITGVLKLLLLFIFIACFFPALCLGAFLQLLNPLLLKLRVPNYYFPSDLIQTGFMQMVVIIAGVRIEVEGSERVPVVVAGKPSSAIVLFSHASNLDTFITASCCPLSVKFIGKKSLFFIPLFGFLMYMYGNIPIDRSNLKKAIESLGKAAKKINSANATIGLSPEGTRSSSGLLQPFKKGPFHLAKETGLSMIPVTLIGAWDLWPPKQIFTSSGTVKVIFGSPVASSSDLQEMQYHVRVSMLKEIKNHYENKKPGKHVECEVFYRFFMPLLTLLSVFILYIYFKVF
jgi:1-acyl-sn-glycerol-3-phosphate acyltransferase